MTDSQHPDSSEISYPARQTDFGDHPAGPYASPAAIDPIADRFTEEPGAANYPPRRVFLPLALYIASFISTFFVGGPVYSCAVMFILTAHELGHFFQALRYRVPASFPYFIPMPASPLGTMGAVIAMRGHMGHRKALFDIGISGPLAGLVPAIVFSIIGIQWSEVIPRPTEPYSQLGDPILFSWLVHWILNPAPTQEVLLHPLAYAGWVGFLITSLNLFPVGQLDGGHILYALLRRRSYPVALMVLVGAAVAMALSGAYSWMPMLLLVYLMGPFHPPTANDNEPLGIGRTVLGVATLLFLIVGFTPQPFYHN